MSKFPSRKNVISVLEMIYRDGYTTRYDIAEHLSISLSGVSVIVRFLMEHNIVEQRKDASHTSKGPKNHRLYLKKNSYFIVIDISSETWRCLLGASGHTPMLICECHYRFDMDFSHNFDVFMSDAAYNLKHTTLYRIFAVSVILPCKKNSYRYIDVKSKKFTDAIDYPQYLPLLNKISHRFLKKAVIPLQYDTLVDHSNCYLRISRGRILMIYSNDEDNIAMERKSDDFQKILFSKACSFADDIEDCELNDDYTNCIYRFTKELHGKYGINNFDVDMNILIGDNISKMQNGITRRILHDDIGDRNFSVSLTCADKSPIYRTALYHSLLIYTDKLMDVLFQRSDTKNAGK